MEIDFKPLMLSKEDANKAIENCKITFQKEWPKLIFGLFFIIIACYGLASLFSNIPSNPSWLFTFTFSILWGLLTLGLTLVINGLTSNISDSVRFQKEVNKKMDALLNIKEKENTRISLIKNYEHFPINLVYFVIVMIFLLDIGILISSGYNSEYIQLFFLSIPSLLLVFVTVWYVRLTNDLVNINQELVQAQTRPSVIAYLKPSNENIKFGDLIIENIGLGTARNIQFSIDPLGFLTIVENKPLEDISFIRNGLPVLGPKDKFHGTPLWFLPQLFEPVRNGSATLDTLQFDITIQYQDSTGKLMNPEKYHIDFGIFYDL